MRRRGTKKKIVNDPKVAVAYLRVSTEEQHLGPEAQRASIKRWAAHEGITVAHWAEDRISGGTELDEREGLTAAMAAIREHRAGVLVVAKRDRLARDTTVAGLIERVVVKNGAKIVAADGVGNGDHPADALMRVLVDGSAAYERAMIRMRTTAALAVLRARGQLSGTTPYGFTIDANKRLIPCDAEQSVIAQVHALRADGCTQRAIVAELARLGVVGRTGKPLWKFQVQAILGRPLAQAKTPYPTEADAADVFTPTASEAPQTPRSE